jgi:hypothetical protein
MIALLKRQRRKQRDAFLSIKPLRKPQQDYSVSQVCEQIARVERELRVLRAMCHLEEPKDPEAIGL